MTNREVPPKRHKGSHDDCYDGCAVEWLVLLAGSSLWAAGHLSQDYHCSQRRGGGLNRRVN